MLPAELFPLVAKLLPAADLGRMESTSRAWRAAVERVVRERAAEWGGFGTGAVQRAAGESWAAVLLFIEMRSQVTQACVALGGTHTLAATSTGALWGWGWGLHGELGHDNTQSQLVPRRVEALAAECVVHVAAGDDHTLAATSAGALWAGGYGGDGQLGHGDTPDQLVLDMPRRVEALALE